MFPSINSRIAFVSLMVVFISCSHSRVSEDELKNKINTIPMLYTVEAQVEVIVEGHGNDGSGEWKSLFGKRDIIVPVKANVKVGIDLSQLRDFEVSGSKVYITLPDPVIQLESSQIAWDDVIDHVSGLRDKFSNKEKEFLTQKGKMKIMGEIPQLDMIRPAQEHAEQILGNLISSLGYTPVFKVRPEYQEFDFVRLIQDYTP